MVATLFSAGGLGSQVSGEAQARLLLELSPAQVALVCGHAAWCGNMQALLNEPAAHREALAAAYREIVGMQQTITASLVAGLFIFAVLPSDGSTIANAEVAHVLGMKRSSCHRYLRTLVAVGLVEQPPGSRKYRLAL
jgi:hypothetical protein